jgi:hypothetical protein
MSEYIIKPQLARAIENTPDFMFTYNVRFKSLKVLLYRLDLSENP